MGQTRDYISDRLAERDRRIARLHEVYTLQLLSYEFNVSVSTIQRSLRRSGLRKYKRRK